MKHLNEYIMEVLAGPIFQNYTTKEFMDYGVWTPNDDLTKNDCKAIIDAFNKKYPNCNILGVDVRCVILHDGVTVQFIFKWGVAPMDTRIKVIQEIINLLTNTIYSVAGDKAEIRRMLGKN